MRLEQPEMAEGLFNSRDLIWWAWVLCGGVSWRGESKLLFARHNPSTLRYKAVLAYNPLLDFLLRDTWVRRLIARLTQAPVFVWLVSPRDLGFQWQTPPAG
jgi:hypothetical protein